MKKIIFSLVAFVAIGLTTKVKAQCTVSALSIENVVFNTGNCTVSFSLSFTQEVNGGNKFAYIHLWTAAGYHTPAANWVGAGTNGHIYGNPSSAPVAADLVNALATVAIKFNGTATPSIDNVYGPGGGVTPLTAGLTITKVILPGGLTERETISGFNLTLPSPCSGVQALKGDIWASQHASGQNVHCVVQGLTFNLNNPQITSAFKVCNAVSPAGRRINLAIKNNGASAVDVKFNVYKDNGDNLFSTVLDGPSLYTSGTINISAGSTTSGISLSANEIPLLGTPGEANNYWVEVETVPAGSFSTVAYIKNSDVGCAPLPVSFKTFTAERNKSTVVLKWETASENNNSGFAVERNINGSWQQVAFVASQASNGNSSTALSYQYVDQNNAKGISQYRIRQVDIDGKSKYSEIRSVKGESQTFKTIVYPNPTTDGKVNIVFEDGAAGIVRDLSVSDMSGRTIKIMKGVSNNNVTIDNLQPGIYSLRIVVPATGEQVVEKIIVNKR